MTRIKHYKSNLLFPRTSMLIGFGSILNISGNYFEFDYSNSEKEADIKAIENDWGVIGNDILEAISTSQKSMVKNQQLWKRIADSRSDKKVEHDPIL